jgi:hypothetical protein
MESVPSVANTAQNLKQAVNSSEATAAVAASPDAAAVVTTQDFAY